MSKAPFRFGCVLLAAGASTRMGRPKQLLPAGGRPLVAHAAEAVLASPAWPVVVVLGAQAEKIRPALVRLPVLIAENPEWAEGLGSSIRAGMAALKNFWRTLDAVLVALADQPALSAEAVARLVAAHHATGRSLVAARYAGRLGAPALFVREHFPALQQLRGDQGARALLDADPDRVAAVDLPEFAFDVDTPADYEKLRLNNAALSPRAASSAKPASDARTVK
ncbi:MAG TPA: nucleotidyltransferase family protein [Opitutaceae bacterium]|nr:nucleotidyltransferase family protein [Opitutaceae bacterium]